MAIPQKLVMDANYTDIIRSGRWLWAYDNLNVRQSVRHEREGINKHTGMSVFYVMISPLL